MLSRLILGSGVLARIVSAASDTLTSPLEGFEVVDIEWDFDAIPGQEHVLLNGTVQEVLGQLDDEFPDLAAESHQAIDVLLEANSTALIGDDEAGGLAKRDHNFCGRWVYCRKDKAQDGINYLRGVGGQPRMGPGPSACGRVSCSYGSAIWWCNDNRHQVTLGSYQDIANAAQLILNDPNCDEFFHSGVTTGWYVRGQRFHNNNINVIVRGDDC